MSGTRLLRARGLRKDFPGVRALDGVSFELRSGEVLAVVGQNGSGKSTLVKLLAGVYGADAGEIAVGSASEDGGEVEMHFIHQTRGLVAELSTVENLALSGKPGWRGMLRLAKRRERRHAEALIRSFGLDFDVTVPVSQISPAERTIVALVRALDGWRRPEGVLVLDEPTAELHGSEVDKLSDVVRRAAAGGAGVIFISHRLDEVMLLADRVLALRDGRVVGDVATSECDHDTLIRLIVGRELDEVRPAGATPGELLLEAKGLGGGGIVDLDLELRAGELVGISGLVGSGRDVLNGMLFGARPRARGEVRVLGEALPPGNVSAAIRRGLAYLPADRHVDGAVMQMSVRENLTLPGLRALRRGFGWLDRRAEGEQVQAWIERVGLRPALPARPLELFSGGNQQKVVMAKWLRMEPRVLLLDEPTQGVDVGAKVAIYALIAQAARAGTGVLIASSDAKVLTEICDRILVIRDGRIVAALAGDEIEEERLIKEELGLMNQTGDGPALVDREEELRA